MEILCTAHYPPRAGGSALSAELLLDAIATRGHQVHVLGPVTPDTAEFAGQYAAQRPPTLTVSRYEVPHFFLTEYVVPPNLEYRQLVDDGVAKGLRRKIEELRPDLLFGFHETASRVCPDLGAESGIPVVLALRGSPTWKIVDGDYPATEAADWLSIYRRADAVVAVSEYMAARLRQMGLEKACHIPNFLPYGRFAGAEGGSTRREWTAGPDEIVVFHASRLFSRKRPMDLVDAAALALDRNSNLVFVILGPLEDAAPLERACRDKGIAHRFRFSDWTEFANMPPRYAAADLVVMPSEGEGLSRVYLEAQAAGCTLIASDIPPAREVIRHGENGLLYPLGDVEALASAILAAARDRSLRESIGRRGRSEARRYDIDTVADEYLALFQRLVGG